MSEKETKKPEVTQEVKSEGGDMKIKSKPKKFTAKDQPVKVDLRKDPNVKVEEPVKVEIKKEDNAIQIGETKEVSMGESSGDSAKVGEPVQESNETTEGFSPIQEVTEEEVKQVKAEVKEAKSNLAIKKMQLQAQLDQQKMQQQHMFDMELKKMEVDAMQAKESAIEDRKDKRTQMEGSQQSAMIDQRNNDLMPINFENEGI